MNTNDAIILARKHVHNGATMQSSAEFALTDAVRQQELGNLDAAKTWAVRSLKYSIGILHADYARAIK